MVQAFHLYRIVLALVLSVVLVLSVAQLTQAKTFPVDSQVTCTITANKPYVAKGEERYIKASGHADCVAGFILRTGMVVELQQYTASGQWVTLGMTQHDAKTAEASARCETFAETYYRTYITVDYETNTGWHKVSEHDEAESLIACYGRVPGEEVIE
jgi:hypothetical protein